MFEWKLELVLLNLRVLLDPVAQNHMEMGDISE